MKRILFILSLFCLCFTFNEVSAIRPVDINNYNFGAKWEELEFSVGGYDPTPQYLFSTSDGGFIVIFSYQEDGEMIPGMDANWEPTGTGTPKSEHAKVVKYTKDFQKQWETNLYEKGNWDNADPLAPTVRTELFQGTELADGSFIFAGEIGIGHPDAIYYRLDKDGNLMYKKIYNGLNPAHNPTSIKNGGYIIKYLYGGGSKPTEFPITANSYKYYYVVYDCNNNIVESFPEGEESRLNNYEFYNQESKENLIYKLYYFMYNTAGSSEKSHPNGENYIWYNEKYLFTTASGDRVYSYASDQRNEIDVKVYDSNGNLKKTILEAAKSTSSVVFEDESYFTFTDGSYMIGNKIFDSNGNKLFDISNINENYRPDNDEFYDNGNYEYGRLSTVLCDGTLVKIQTVYKRHAQLVFTYKIQYKKTSPKENEDFANLVIAGEEIKMNVGTIHLENDRTYISIDNLCSQLGCSHKRAKSDNDMLVIYFPVFDKSNKFFEGDINYDYKNPMLVYDTKKGEYGLSNEPYKYIESAFYVVEHKIETKFYQSYLDVTPYNIFGLKSPTYNADSVDVTSKIINGEVYVPLRFVAEALGRYVTYTPGIDGGKPTITISAAGEGEFYEKYGVVVSKTQYFEGDDIANKEATSTIKLRTGKLYSYGIDKVSNTVINTNQTIFFPLAVVNDRPYNSFIDRRPELKNNTEYYVGYHSGTGTEGKNYGGLSCKQNYLWREVTPISNTTKEESPVKVDYPYLAISSINGYPFMKIVYIDLKK